MSAVLGAVIIGILGSLAAIKSTTRQISDLAGRLSVGNYNQPIRLGRTRIEEIDRLAEAIEYPIRKCAHFTEYAVLGITVNLYLWMCYRMEMLLSRKKKAKDIQRTEEKLQKTVKQKAVVQENVLPEIRNIKEKVTAQESATQETEIARQTVENTEQKMELSIWNFIIRAEIFCALYACSDEFHQYFVPGRSCKFFDVCVDSTGTFFGALLFWGIFHLREQKRERKRQEISKKSKS